MTWSLRQFGHASRRSETKIQHVSSCSRRNDFIDPPKPFESVRDFKPSTRCSRGLRASGHREIIPERRRHQRGTGKYITTMPRRPHYIYV